ncbi:MAG TPA: winged helix-turn-helix domain-containing protein [Methanocella sp.]|nr:winged helix-turn-helix domain-containing protein [Methanocella sp.]
MHSKQKPGEAIPELLVVEDPAAIKLLFTPKYMDIIKLLGHEELSISDLARRLDINPGSAHYHLKTLEKHKLVKQVREEIHGGVVKKFYRNAAISIVVDTGKAETAGTASTAALGPEYIDRLVKHLSLFGYPIPNSKLERAKADLMRSDARAKAIMKELQQIGLEQIEGNRVLVSNVYQVAILLKLIEDKEFLTSMRDLIAIASKNSDKDGN